MLNFLLFCIKRRDLVWMRLWNLSTAVFEVNTKLWIIQVINAFFLRVFSGSAYDLPRHYLFAKNLTNPDDYKSLFTQTVSDSVNVFGVSSAISRPPAPIFVSLLSLASTWDSLQVIIPTMLTYGIVGYPFLLPGPVGGDFQVGNVSFHALIPPEGK